MRLPQVGDRCPDGHLMQAGDVPSTDPQIAELSVDDGEPDSASVCGLTDGKAICCLPGAYTMWMGGLPRAVCILHAAGVRHWPDAGIERVHTVRPAGVAADWKIALPRVDEHRVVRVTSRGGPR